MRTCEITPDSVRFVVTGPLGKATAEGPRGDWARLRAQAEFQAGFRAEP